MNTTSFIAQHNFSLTGCFNSSAHVQASFGQESARKYLAGTMNFDLRDPAKNDCHALSPFLVSTLARGVDAELRFEEDAEAHRRRLNGLLPSRLSAVYVFGDDQSCREASARHHWPMHEVQRFKLDDFPGTRVARLNMEIVSWARGLHASGLLTPALTREIWDAYWHGRVGVAPDRLPPGFPTAPTPIWEFLIEGRVSKVT